MHLKLMKALTISILLILGFTDCAQARNTSDLAEIDVYVSWIEGDKMRFGTLESDVQPYIAEGSTMVPLRAVAETFGYIVDYKEDSRKITIQDAARENELVFTIGSAAVSRNGVQGVLPQSPVIRDGRVFVPLRYISEFFDKYVTWEKSLSGDCVFVWVSSLPLLEDQDADVEKDANFFRTLESINQGHIYQMKESGRTFRGVKIGDGYERVVELYGTPHERDYKDGGIWWASYYSKFTPDSDDVSILSFNFTNGIVDAVYVDEG